MSLIRKHGAVLQTWACLALVLITDTLSHNIISRKSDSKYRSNNYKTGTPPLREGVDGPPAGGVHLFQGGVLPPTGWLDKPLTSTRIC